MSKKTGESQNAFLLRHLMAGETITRMEAFHYGIANITARVADLRAEGHDVRCEWKKDAKGAEYGRFSLHRETRLAA